MMMNRQINMIVTLSKLQNREQHVELRMSRGWGTIWPKIPIILVTCFIPKCRNFYAMLLEALSSHVWIACPAAHDHTSSEALFLCSVCATDIRYFWKRPAGRSATGWCKGTENKHPHSLDLYSPFYPVSKVFPSRLCSLIGPSVSRDAVRTRCHPEHHRALTGDV